MTYQIPQHILDRAEARRQESRDAQAASLLSSTAHVLRSAAIDHGIDPNGKSDLDLVSAIVDRMYPPAQSGLPGNPADDSKPLSAFGGFQPPAGTIVPDLTSDVQAYRDMVTLAPGENRTDTNLDMARMVFGFDANELRSQRSFVAFLDARAGGSAVKLEVDRVLNLSGFDADARMQSSVVVVKIPSWWLDADYVRQFVGEMYAGVMSGEPELAIDMLIKFAEEQRWNLDELLPGGADLDALLDTMTEWRQARDKAAEQSASTVTPPGEETTIIPSGIIPEEIYRKTDLPEERTPIADTIVGDGRFFGSAPAVEPTQLNPVIKPDNQ